MTRAARSFRPSDVCAAIKAVKRGDIPVWAVDFPPEGGFRLLLGEPDRDVLPFGSGKNEWDEVLAT